MPLNKTGNEEPGSPSVPGKMDSLQGMEPIVLLKPVDDSSSTVWEALKQRKTIREISGEKLPLQVLSNLLWAACGVNRWNGPDSVPGRTAASASNSQEIDVLVALAEGTYLYDALNHSLIPVAAGDMRKLAIGKGQEKSVSQAPVRLIYVADIHKLTHTQGYREHGLYDPEIQKSYYYVATGLIAGNVYLYAASHGLASWFHNCNKPELTARLNLRPEQRVLFGQTIGYPVRK